VSNQGFTLLECLIALAITMGLLIFTTPFVKEINKWWQFQEDASYIELQIGKKQLEHEISELEFVEVKKNKLVYQRTTADKEKVIFELYEGMLRKSPGFQPIITNIKEVYFIEHHQFIEMVITTIKEEDYVYFLQK